MGEAKERGLEDYNVGTYPSELLISKGTGLKGVVAGALLTAAFGGGGFALSHFLQQPEKETVERIIDRVFDSDIEMEIIPPQ